MGTSISTTVWENRATLHHQHLVEQLGQGNAIAGETVAKLTAGGLSPEQAWAQINRLIDQQAFTRAADDIFLASAGLFLLLILSIWLTKRPPRIAGAAPIDTSGAH
jgi:DHA2 family multidrug resistance protein